MWLALLLGCPGGGGDDWGLMADQVGEGMLLAAWSDGEDVLFVGGDLDGGPGVTARYDGDSLCTSSNVTERALWWVHGTAPGEWWAVGEAGTALHHTGGADVRDDVPTEATLFGVWATDTEVWAVGGSVSENTGEVWRKTDGDWQAIATDLPGIVFKVWDNWFVGRQVAYTWNGSELEDISAGENLLTVRGRSDNDVWAVGGTTSAAVLHWADGDWTAFDNTSLGQPLNGVWTDPGETVWVAGNFGTAAFWDDEAASWSFSSPPTTAEHFHAVWKHNDEVFFAGGNFFSPGNNTGTITRYGPNQGLVDVTACP